ncbi:hypothetical protein L596_009434 [Steinernema carpocapsae]|uniref:Uncharacterized protein n=1 Tax=Steinernema carpocapsae TaxID=34508 RepID=A0A4U5PFC0_STECR|nr:hypothetical protein L596_009434 [Steinernema carpocapsae]
MTPIIERQCGCVRHIEENVQKLAQHGRDKICLCDNYYELVTFMTLYKELRFLEWALVRYYVGRYYVHEGSLCSDLLRYN